MAESIDGPLDVDWKAMEAHEPALDKPSGCGWVDELLLGLCLAQGGSKAWWNRTRSWMVLGVPSWSWRTGQQALLILFRLGYLRLASKQPAEEFLHQPPTSCPTSVTTPSSRYGLLLLVSLSRLFFLTTLSGQVRFWRAELGSIMPSPGIVWEGKNGQGLSVRVPWGLI